MAERLDVEELKRRMVTWEFHLERLSDIAPRCPGGHPARILEGFRHLRGFLGEDWLHGAYKAPHPLIQDLNQSTPWVWRRLSDLGWALNALQACVRFEDVLTRLRNPNESTSARQQVDYAIRYVQSGHTVEFEPAVGDNNADLLVKGDLPFYIELKGLQESQSTKASLSVSQCVIERLFTNAAWLGYAGAVHKALAGPDLDTLLSEIEAAKVRVQDASEPVRISKEGAYDLILYPAAIRDTVPEQFRNTLKGPAFGSNEYARILRPTRKALEDQLPHSFPSLLIIDTPAPFFPTTAQKSPEKIVAQFERELLERKIEAHAGVTAFVLVGSIGDPRVRPSHVDHGHFQTFTRVQFDFLVEFGVIIKNLACRHAFQQEMLTPLIASHA